MNLLEGDTETSTPIFAAMVHEARWAMAIELLQDEHPSRETLARPSLFGRSETQEVPYSVDELREPLPTRPRVSPRDEALEAIANLTPDDTWFQRSKVDVQPLGSKSF